MEQSRFQNNVLQLSEFSNWIQRDLTGVFFAYRHERQHRCYVNIMGDFNSRDTFHQNGRDNSSELNIYYSHASVQRAPL